MRNPLLASSILTALAALSSAKAPTLAPGTAAPSLDVAGWLRYGAPKAGQGHLRVVEFWATWCAPCKASMPHLTALAHKYKGKIDFVGVSVMENAGTTPADLKQFVNAYRDKMDYRVAYDKADGTMARTWLDAAGQKGIPASFLVDDKGQVLWIGHPMNLEKPIEDALAGKLDVDANRAAFLGTAKADDDATAIRNTIYKAGSDYKAGRKAEAEKAWDSVVATSPKEAGLVQAVRIANYPPGSPESLAILDKMVEGNVAEQASAADIVTRMPKGDPRALALLNRVAAHPKSVYVFWSLARAFDQIEAYPETIKAVDAGLAQIAVAMADPAANAKAKQSLEIFKKELTQIRDDAVEKSGAKG